MTTSQLIDLKAFCSTDQTRPKLLTPWFDALAHRSAASDGRVIVIVDGRHPQVDPDNPGQGKISFFVDGLDPACKRELLKIPFAEEERECPDCEGARTTGDAPCEWCEGKGTVIANRPILWGGAIFGETYLRRIARLPQIELEAKPDPWGLNPITGHNCGAQFVFHGGFGFIMPRLCAPGETVIFLA